jgi:hypothetical protein
MLLNPKIMSWLFPGMIILALLLDLFLPAAVEFFAIDDCLDKGGKYDHDSTICITEVPEETPEP